MPAEISILVKGKEPRYEACIPALKLIARGSTPLEAVARARADADRLLLNMQRDVRTVEAEIRTVAEYDNEVDEAMEPEDLSEYMEDPRSTSGTRSDKGRPRATYKKKAK
ncbi:MAG: hypothetical protein Q8L55_15350 [Phycisphaerales bacterium]|nr:hypothetical protein [Phycisphaerales bacterium]